MRQVPFLRCAVVTLGVSCAFACGSTPTVNSAVEFSAETNALPDAKADTGLQPANSSVQLQLTVTAAAKTTLAASAYASGSTDAPVLTAKPQSGKLSVHGSFGLNARLVVSIKGLPSYDGPVPGIENSNIAFGGESAFDPFLLDGQLASVAATIPSVNLPDIPLPAGIPGVLKIMVAEGSTVSAEFRGVCAAIEKTTAQYTGTLTHTANLVLKPSIEIDVPVVGKKSFPIPDILLPVSVPQKPIDLGSKEVSFGAEAGGGNRAAVGRCDGASATPSPTHHDAGASDAIVSTDADGASTAVGTRAACTAKANGNRDAYSACCSENAQGATEFDDIITAAICKDACKSACQSDYCANGGTAAGNTCHECIQSSNTQVSISSALASQCTSETCSRYYDCYAGTPKP